ncbi:unnamed protein product [Parnassius mnemosyne]|uniref:Uncharacterized protein n=1 Tax=Parnassius mnemosyne TaxID=213953 RepID=A0AAV1KCN3_9NEOP
MDLNIIYGYIVVLTLQTLGASTQMCPDDLNCVCRGTSIECNCNINGQSVKIDTLPGVYMNIKCENIATFNYSKLPQCVDRIGNLKSGVRENGMLQNNETTIKTPTKEVLVDNKNLICGCQNFWFLDFVQTHWKTKVAEVDFKHCNIWSFTVCYMTFYIMIFIIATFMVIAVIVTFMYFIYKQKVNAFLKRICFNLFRHTFYKKEDKKIVVKYSIFDEEFVLQEIIPGLKDYDNAKIIMKPVMTHKNNLMKKIMSENGIEMTFVIFSPNYLMTTYSQVNIKKIRGEMLKAKNTVYIFVDIGPDNSIYAFLKEQRDPQISILWNELNFWGKVMDISSRDFQNRIKDRKSENASVKKLKKVKFSSKKSFMRLSDWPHFETFETFAHSQV